LLNQALLEHVQELRLVRFVGKLVGALRKRGDYLIIFLASVVATLLWFRGESLAIGEDDTIPFHPLHWITRYLSAWNTWVDAGTSMLPHYKLPVFDVLVYSLFTMLGLSISDAQKLYLSLMSFVGSASVYYLTSTLMSSHEHKRCMSFCSVLLWLYNPWIMSTTYHRIAESYFPRAVLPLIFALHIKGLEDKKIRYSFLLGLASLLLFSVFPKAEEFLFAVGGGLLFCLFYIFRSLRNHHFRSTLVFLWKFHAIAIAVSIVVNLYWLVPFVQTFSVWTTKLETYPITWSSHKWTTVLNVLRLFGNWPFYEGNYVPYASVYLGNPLVVLLTFVLTFLVFSAILFKPRNRSVVFFSVLAVGTLFLAKGITPPMGDIYKQLVSYIPFFELFYNSLKFFPLLLILYCFLFGVACGSIYGKISSLKPNSLAELRFVVIGMIIAIIVTTSWPLATGDVFVNWYKPTDRGVSVPKYYFDTNEWLNSQIGDYRVLIVPYLGAGQYVANHWGYQGTNLFYELMFTQPLIVGTGVSYLERSFLGEFGYAHSFQYGQDMISYACQYPVLGGSVNQCTLLESCDSINRWRFNNDATAKADRIAVDSGKFVEGSSSLRWTIEKSGNVIGGHQITFDVSEINYSIYDVLVLWVSENCKENSFQVGIEDKDGNVGWYNVTQHIEYSNSQGWKRVSLWLTKPDSAFFDIGRVHNVILRYDVVEKEIGSSVVWIDGIYAVDLEPNGFVYGKILALLNAKYVLLDTSVDWGMYPNLVYFPYEKILNFSEIFSLERVNGSLKVYRNNMPMAHLYSTSKVYLTSDIDSVLSLDAFDPNSTAFVLRNQLDAQAEESFRLMNQSDSQASLKIKETNPSRYVVHVRADAPFILVFSETFDSGWKAQVEGNEIGDHFIVNGYANGWYIQKEGEYDITITFEPQKFSNLPKLVSAIGILACMLGLLYTGSTGGSANYKEGTYRAITEIRRDTNKTTLIFKDLWRLDRPLWKA